MLTHPGQTCTEPPNRPKGLVGVDRVEKRHDHCPRGRQLEREHDGLGKLHGIYDRISRALRHAELAARLDDDGEAAHAHHENQHDPACRNGEDEEGGGRGVEEEALRTIERHVEHIEVDD